VLLDTSYVYPVEQAKINALNLAAQLLDKKDGITRTISKFITVPSLYTLNGKTTIKTDFSISKPWTPSLYIANFNKKDGYVILSADKRATEILATVGSGTIDSLAHPGLQVFLSNAILHIDEKVAEMEALREDATFKSMVEKLQQGLSKEKNGKKTTKGGRTGFSDPCPTLRVPGRAARTALCEGGGCIYVSSTVPIQTVSTINTFRPPLLTTLWYQGPPYNDGMAEAGCDNYGCSYGLHNTRYLVGCVPISEGQIVAYFFAKNNAFWQSVVGKSCASYTPEEATSVATLAHSIFIDYGIYVDRGCGSTGAGFQLGDLQFTNPRGISTGYGLVQGEWRSWNTGDIRNSLSNGSPVLIQGKIHLCWVFFGWVGCGDGHQWVIDGMRDLGVQTTYWFTAYYDGLDCTPEQGNYYQSYTYTTTTTTATQIHQNWGWGPDKGSESYDWYAQDVFQSSYQVPGWDNNYNHANYIVAYIGAN
jgi:hypothetical protein